jgi:hypothetical protein
MMKAVPARRPRGGPAVMSRRFEAAGSLDDFPTPPWAVRALCEWLCRQGHRIEECAVREPAAGRGHMARALREYFALVQESDIHAYGRNDLRIADFLDEMWPVVDWTITNPPFRLAEEFCRQALATSRDGVAMLVRIQFLEGTGRFVRLFSVNSPSAVLQFVERVPMLRGRLDPAVSTATSYCWLVWELRRVDPTPRTEFVWLPPCRRRFEREGDYA